MSKFTRKLTSLGDTLTLFRAYDVAPLSQAIRACSKRNVIAVGSGGSHVAAAYFACCLRTLGLGPASIQTPMEVVVGTSDLDDTDVWLFSASANNADIAATARAVYDRGCSKIALCTRNAEGSVADWVRHNGGQVFTLPVAELKDGYLATHSLLSTCVGLLLASELLSDDPQLEADRLGELEARVAKGVDAASRADLKDTFSNLTTGTTLLVVADPMLQPLSMLLETSLWEASLCPVQVTDMRNFAHGRHSWLHHHLGQTVMLGLTGQCSREPWKAILGALPSEDRVLQFDYSGCGRRINLLALIDGLFWLEAIGAVVGIDPGKPGIADFGRVMYEDRSLVEIARKLLPAVRQKRAAAAKTGRATHSPNELYSAFASKMCKLASAEIGGVVMDFDGTVVSTSNRLHPPCPDVVAELERLNSLGVAIGFASGRGGSLGDQLRRDFSKDMISSTLVGYFNGGHLASADFDIDEARPAPNPVIEEVADWLATRSDLWARKDLQPKEIQLSIDFETLLNPTEFNSRLLECPAVREKRVSILSSGHSFDIVPAQSNKLAVVQALERTIGSGQEVLSLGDSGTRLGNDYSLLTREFGISVGGVCPVPDGCWSLFGTRIMGPEALLKILRSMLPSSSGGIRLNKASLDLDFLDANEYE
jgi:fructoselysine-6-P-deglycase FrlB-like protein/hydroxymethylpyrimidine pyrophosphatase-like HAD family hydrolase